VPEIRIDPLTGLRAIVATELGELGGEELAIATVAGFDIAGDPFVEEHAGGALRHDARQPEPDSHPALYMALAARGAHELIVNTPRSVSSLADLSVDELQGAVDIWRARMRAQEEAAYVHLGVDEGLEAVAAHPQSHAQLYALDYVPAAVARERERFSAHAMRTMGGNLLEDLIQEEVRRRVRIVAIDDEAVLSCPYASQHEFQLMLTPRRRRDRFEAEGPSGAALLHDALSRLRRHFGAGPPLSLWVRTAPRDAERFCWRIDIVPRLRRRGSLELGSGTHVNTVAPEQAAAELREA
jgi:UDPglucose--hexose-1-phosphate uridylyltransferase